MLPKKQERVCPGWDVVLFFALYIIAPAYLAVELHPSIPLITASRAALVLLGLCTVIRRRSLLRIPLDWKDLNFGLTENRLLRWGLLTYFGMLLISNLALFPTDKGESVKAIFVLVMEEYMLVWLLSLAIDTRKKLETALGVLSATTGVVGVVAVVGTIINYNPFHLLDTVAQEMLMTEYYRLGALRAAAGFGHPVFYGAFCVIMTPVMMYFTEHSDRVWKRLLFGAGLSFNWAGLFLSNSRGSMIAIVALLVIILLVRILRRDLKRFLLTYIPVFAGTAVIVAVAIATMPHGDYYMAMTMRSLYMEFAFLQGGGSGATTTTETTEPTTIPVEYGDNASGSRSRLVQLTGVWRTLQNKPIFGYGSNAHVRGLIYYQFNGEDWWPGGSFDMGLVSIICQYGLVGLVGYGAMYGSVFLTTAQKRHRQDLLMEALGLAFIGYMGCMMVISSLAKMLWVLIGAIVCLHNITRKEQENIHD